MLEIRNVSNNLSGYPFFYTSEAQKIIQNETGPKENLLYFRCVAVKIIKSFQGRC